VKKDKKEIGVSKMFAIIAEILREEIPALFSREKENTLKIRLVGGKEFRLLVEDVEN